MKAPVRRLFGQHYSYLAIYNPRLRGNIQALLQSDGRVPAMDYELLENIHVLWAIDVRERTNTIWWEAKQIEVVLPNKPGLIHTGTFCTLSLQAIKNSKGNILKPRCSLHLLRSLDCVSAFSDNEYVWILADDVEPELHPLLLQRNGLKENGW